MPTLATATTATITKQTGPVAITSAKAIVSAVRLKGGQNDTFPFNIPLFANFDELQLASGVTFFAGDNGTGKSTLIEGMAQSARLPALVQSIGASNPLLAAGAALAQRLTLVKSRPVRHGCYFRADDVTGFLQRIQQTAREHEAFEDEFADIKGDWGRNRAIDVARGERRALSERYGENPFAQSHGEGFLALLQSRLTAVGLYLLDEPEAPLSPSNQIALLGLILHHVKRGSQFVIASHSPILMACPHARIYDFHSSPPEPCAWDDLDHVQTTRAFLNHPDTFLRHFQEDGEPTDDC